MVDFLQVELGHSWQREELSPSLGVERPRTALGNAKRAGAPGGV